MAPVKQYSAVIVGGTGDPRTSDATFFVAAVHSLGVPAIERCPFVETIEEVGGETKLEHSWNLKDVSPCGRYKTAALRKAWLDADWLARNRGDVLARIHAAFAAHEIDNAFPPHPESLPPDVKPPDLLNLPSLPPDWLAFGRAVSDQPAVCDALTVLGLLRQELKNSVPLMVVREGGRRVLIPADASEAEQLELLTLFHNRNK